MTDLKCNKTINIPEMIRLFRDLLLIVSANHLQENHLIYSPLNSYISICWDIGSEALC